MKQRIPAIIVRVEVEEQTDNGKTMRRPVREFVEFEADIPEPVMDYLWTKVNKADGK